MFDPADPSKEFNITDGDGMSIEIEEGINMAWSQFEYVADVMVKFVSTGNSTLGSVSTVQLRPKFLLYNASNPAPDTILIHVPYDERGTRFSVEFQDDIFQFRTNGTACVLTDDALLVSEEPRNALILFASSPIDASVGLSKTSSNAHVLKRGAITAGSLGAKPTLYFEQGIYWTEADGVLGKSHMILHPDTSFVYMEPGTYIKGALEYTTSASDFRLIGHGVLSGESYAYQANWNESYTAVKSDRTSLRMIFHQSVTNDQTMHLQGATLNAPLFNTVDLLAFLTKKTTSQLYAGTASDIFWHVNDDAIKLYQSNMIARNITIWKVYNDPVVQMGWKPRNVSNVTVDGLDIIHSRWYQSLSVVPSAIVGASPYYADPKLVDSNRTIRAEIRNVRCEGICPVLMRIAPMNNYDLTVENVWFESMIENDTTQLGESLIGAKISDQENSYVEGQDGLNLGIYIRSWEIGQQLIDSQNWQVGQLGQLNFNSSFLGDWSIQ